MQGAAAIVTAVASLVGALAWPLLVLLVILRFHDGLAEFFRNLGELTIKAPGLKASARRQIEAAVNVGAALTKSGSSANGPVVASAAAVQLAEALPSARRQRDIRGSLVLWVDDHPENNAYERQALEALGIRFMIATSTDDALMQIQEHAPDLIISDMGRPPDSRAGYTLLDELRRHRDDVPVVIYASSRDPEHVREAKAHGALGCTNSPQELIGLVTQGLRA